MRASSSALLLAASLCVPAVAAADVKTQERTQVRFEGAIGKMVNMFGGRGAREGITSTVALKGQRLLTITGDTGEIIDLAEKKVYTLDLKGKSYTVMTFAEMRKKMEEAMAKAEKDAAAMKPEPDQPADGDKKEYEVDFTIADGPGAKVVAGNDTKEKVATITVREKGKTLESAGGFILETHLWMAPQQPALQELADFRMRYAQEVYGPMVAQAGPSMAQAMAMYPQMKEAMAKFADEAKKLDGAPLLTEMIFIAAVPPGSQSNEKAEPAPGLGGLIGGLGRFGRKKGNDAPAPAPAAAAAAPGRSTVLTTTNETLQITPSATDADVALPAGLKLK